jgi:hypothetical protein
MKRRELIKYLSVVPVSGAVAGAILPFQSSNAEELTTYQPNPQSGPKRIAAIISVYFTGSHADVIVGKYLEGYNQDEMAPYPDSKVVSMFLEQFGEGGAGRGDISRDMSKKHNVPIFRTVADALTLGGDTLAVDGVILIGEHGTYPMNDKEQKLYPRFEMFLKITDVFRQYKKSVPVFNDKHLSWNWRQAKRMVEISKELKFPMFAGSTIPVSLWCKTEVCSGHFFQWIRYLRFSSFGWLAGCGGAKKRWRNWSPGCSMSGGARLLELY